MDDHPIFLRSDAFLMKKFEKQNCFPPCYAQGRKQLGYACVSIVDSLSCRFSYADSFAHCHLIIPLGLFLLSFVTALCYSTFELEWLLVWFTSKV